MMRHGPHHWKPRGMTLIELMVVVAIIALILVAGLPSFATWGANSKVRHTAESVQNAMRLAQSEAVRRNANVTLCLTTDSAPGPSSTCSDKGINWVLRDADNGVIQSKGTESATNVTVQSSEGFDGNIVFTGLGRTTERADVELEFGVPDNDAVRKLKVQLTPAGRVRMCDPKLPSDDTQACK